MKKLPSIEVGPTALACPTTLTYDLTYNSPASYGHDLLTRKSSRSTVSWFRRQSGNKRTDGRTEAIALLATLMPSVMSKN